MKLLRNLVVAAVLGVAALLITPDNAYAWSSCDSFQLTCQAAGGHLLDSSWYCDMTHEPGPNVVYTMHCIRDYDGADLEVRDCSWNGIEYCWGTSYCEMFPWECA